MLLLVEIKRVRSWISVGSRAADAGAGAGALIAAGGGDGKLKRLEVVFSMFYDDGLMLVSPRKWRTARQKSEVGSGRGQKSYTTNDVMDLE